MDKEKFVSGMIIKKPHEKAPEYIKANIAINIGDFLNWANKYSKNGWVNIVIKESKGGKYYAEIDTFEPKKQEYTQKAQELESKEEYPDTENIEYPTEDIDVENIPF